MKRIFSVMLVMAVMVAMLMASAIPAFAASEKGGCVGQVVSSDNALGKQGGIPGAGGFRISNRASGAGGLGDLASGEACRP